MAPRNLTHAQLPGASRREFLRVSGLAGLAVGSWSLTGCGLFDQSTPGGTGDGAAGQNHLRITFTTVETLDPQVITNGMWILSRGLLEGLVTQNETGDDVIPAVAEDWRTSDDLLTYTFTLRSDARWSNGDPVTAQDFERTYRRLLTPSGGSTGGTTAGANSYQASTGIKGAVDFLSGVTDDWSTVGIEAEDAQTLRITLESPNPDLLLALTHPALLPLHMDSVEQKKDSWQEPPNFVSNGAYQVEEWTKNSSLELTPNKEYWNAKEVSLDRITVFLVEPTASGTNSVPYENGETDILQVSDADVLRFQEDPKLTEHLHEVDTYSIAYLGRLRSEHPAMDDVRVRKALSIALDRKRLAEVVSGARPGVSLVTDRTLGWDESIAVEESVEEAKQLLADAGYPGGKGLPEIRILSGVDSPLVDAIIDTWKRNLDIPARADTVEAGVYTERRWQVQKDDYIGFYFGTFAGLPTWPTMVGTLWSPEDIQRFSLPSEIWGRFQQIELDEEMDADTKAKRLQALLTEHRSDGATELLDLVPRATREPDEKKRVEMFLRAAKIREEEYVFVPVGWLSVYFAIRPNVTGVSLRPYPDFFYLGPLGLKQS